MSIGRPSDRRLLAGTYLILEEIDEGGQVIKAHDCRHRRVVALKVVPPSSVGDPEALAAFEREAEAARRLEHPNVAAVLDAGEDLGVHFIAMEYVEGSDLGRVVRHRGPLRLDQAIDILIQMARGLEAAQARGIVHRDLKPSKLMLDATGTVRVLGLGQARFVAGTNPFDETAGVRSSDSRTDLRSADYMAPEVAEDPRRSDPRADIYSLGCILYFLLAGREPFVGDTLRDRLTAHRDRPAPKLQVVRPDVPSMLEEAYERMMAKQPDDRPSSMAEVIGLLESCRAVVETSAPSRPVPPEGSKRPSTGETGRKRHPASPRAEGEARVVARADESAGVPIGPEFDLAGLGMEGRPRSESVPPRGAPADRVAGLRGAESKHPAWTDSAIVRRLSRPAIVLGLAAIAVGAAVALSLAFRSGEAGPPSVAPPSAGGDGGLVNARKVDRGTEANPQPPPRPEWVSRTIFDGQDLRDWMLTSKRPLPRKQVQPDGLNPHGAGSYLVVYRHKLGDFILDFDYKLSRGCNSGVFLRVGDLDDPVNTGIEVSLQDPAGRGYEDSGAIYGLVAPSADVQKPAGEWNHMTITAQGPVIAVSINATGVSRINLDEWSVPGKRPDGSVHKFADVAVARLPRSGYLGFQDLVGDCWFKNIVLKSGMSRADDPAGALRP